MKNKKIALWALAALLLSGAALTIHSKEEAKRGGPPKEGYVPTAETAVKIAVAVWLPIYGEAAIEKEKPYKAVLKDGTWYVTGSLPEGRKGGVAEAEISRKNGCIGRVGHGK